MTMSQNDATAAAATANTIKEQDMSRLNLLPMPKSVRQGKGSFRLEDNVPVVLAPEADAEVNAAWSFAVEADVKARLALPLERHGKLGGIKRRILFLVAGRDDALYPKLRQLAKPIANAPKTVRDQAYVLKVTKNEIVAAATTPAGLYYAAQTLRQLVTKNGRVPCVTITDWPAYAYRGVMLDISRFKVPRLDSLFELIERLAALKINVFQIYTEHTFAFRRHPDISEGCSPVTAEDVIELDGFCKQHFVDLQANYQSFGHQNHMLGKPEYNDMAESPGQPFTMSPAVPRTYKFLDDAYAECLPAYSSKLFNASCDETWDLGSGRSKNLADNAGVGRVYLEHIKKINKLAHKYGKRMMIWGDIILQHPELIADIPKDIIMLDWGYSAGADLSGMKRFKAAGLEFWTCPGVSAWHRIFAHFDNASRNIAERAAAGQKNGATGLLNTHWGDGGHPQMFSAAFRGYAWGAEQSWTPSLET
ncbi:MAG: glycoside hydrolase family 20 zincin-like fold domain-containing protein, partial [Planctomycetota bacterium]